ncbi:MAG: 4-hydroxythreonine-4-phosphate dehydrogenase PdxA [Ignavibacteria bacterium RIFOXYB2_FULL_35_12]|nr:MAG: 4-hydroxythreonine-4-phosphate dehydrogenase PdxA [Ignavibacteria bacterium GWA2_36_19]OGU50155.1 MAG: 4-hydroxythreonine-4-phosphate dehydrogenase PdxA [Ignavibacteria bacterium GWC2_35_8]OGU62198.1 MAG: 4-hydroxythreonine-4-phosphate dehydrogenase PdxA [Ignavibacteria bacterium GWF2_35_20]OGU83334.1 MAG: 4-hydroxythreonine-4-phosphate dehydrogenase PdxA [Ignavibacteria bacterium RIFOXYA2_FULL_35_9]OGU84604.1 MAG: 4-hydroxythreonine-4-phosphate dehydrogenase PdxA [Ignavibacteria bacter
MNTFIFTCGDINGVGPELVIKTLNRVTMKSKDKFIFILPENVFFSEIKMHKPNFGYDIVNSTSYSSDFPVTIVNIGNYKQELGLPTTASGQASYKALKIAYDIPVKSINKAVITAPISKTALAYAKINYHGQTEMFADWSEVKNFAMMFLSKSMKAALLTIHQPIKKVPRLIRKDLLATKFNLILDSLRKDFKVELPKIAVLGLNPHAGENGLIGDEEKKIIVPFMKKFSKRKYFFGPYSSDAFFGMKKYLEFDMVIGMYHDQILNAFKLMNFNSGVNFTAGLPIVRTSPDHGTAFDIAGKGIADESSMIEAFNYAEMILVNRSSYGKNS